MARAKSGGARQHLGALALFAALTVGWTWPLASRLADAIPGHPGDNYSFVWNMWWMRQALTNADLSFFHTAFLFHPFGTSLVDHPHTALPALVGATLLARLSVVTAHNVLLLTFVFANMACTYALAWNITRHHRASILAAVVFGLSPYLSAHVLGHFDLVAAWVIPLFVLLMLRALHNRSYAAAIGAGLVLAATAYTTYYYVVYVAALALLLIVVWLDPVRVSSARRDPPLRSAKAMLALLAGVLLAAAAVIAATGGTTIAGVNVVISMRRPQNTLTAAWIVLLLWAAATWRPVFHGREVPSDRVRWSVRTLSTMAAVFAIAAAPLVWMAAHLYGSGGYVTQPYFWRSMPMGVDLLGPLALHPNHPLTRALSQRLYAAWHMNTTEAIAWMGVVPLVLAARVDAESRRSSRVWQAIVMVFGLVALGPILTVGGVDVGLRLPAILLRFIPIVDNARMPGRAMVGVFLALAMLIAIHVASARGRLARPVWQWVAIAAVVAEFWTAPIPLTPLDRPPALEALASEPAGAVCEVPSGIGDGLSGVGSQDRRVLYDATIHAHPITGGYIGRMPPDAADRYDRMPFVGDLLKLSEGRPPEARVVTPSELPCRYVILRQAATPAMRKWVLRLPLAVIGQDAERAVYRIER